MENSIFHRLSNVLWGIIVTLIVLLAIYVSVGRLLVSSMGDYRDSILRELNHRLPFIIEARQARGEWRSFTPVLVLSGLRVKIPGYPGQPLELSEGRVGVDVLNSLRTGSLRVTSLQLDGLALRGELSSDGQLRIRGFTGGDGQVDQWITEFLLAIEQVVLGNNVLQLTMPGGEVRRLDLDLHLSRDGSHRRLEAELVSTRGTRITALAEGVGNPFRPEQFSGELYLDIDSSDLGAIREMLADAPPAVWAEGALDMELWLSWDKGEAGVEARIEARDLLLSPENKSWQIPVDRLALEATLLEQRNRWTVFASNLEIEKGSTALRLPRLQLDAWGEAIRVRAIDVPLAPVNDIVSGLDLTPAGLADVLRTLQPRGIMPALQISIGDIGAPASDWETAANFGDVVVQSWKGAPGVTSASGYAELRPGGGFVIVDSQQFSMDFPAIYREPLYFDDLHGTINIDWDTRSLSLSSGLITARGVEGALQALFGLDIPLVKSDVGLEMDLLVGLQDSSPMHRSKYLPYTLNRSLLDWLSGSIGEGRIEQGAFLWRGSLRRHARPLRTMQLFFNVADTSLDYHPRWPAVTDLDGTVLIDDTSVSVWSEDARLFGSDVGHLSAETWVNGDGKMLLALDATVRGPAADGRAVLTESPLAALVGQAFTDWELGGELETDLNLQMSLTDKSLAPEVVVATRWRGVDLDIRPGNLPIRGVDGELHYSTARGFSSANLAGTLWGRPLSATVDQVSAFGESAYDSGSSIVELQIDTEFEMGDVREWLDLDLLELAEGRAPVEVRVAIAPGASPRLELHSSLQGVALDLPAPWRKTAVEQRDLQLTLPLGAENMLLDLSLGREIAMRLDMAERKLRSGALGLGREPAALEEGRLLITGSAAVVDVDEWTAFVSRYLSRGLAGAEAGNAVPRSTDDPNAVIMPPSGLAAAVDPQSMEESGRALQDTPLTIVIDELQANTLSVMGQDFEDVVFSLSFAGEDWHLSAQTSWLRGEFLLAAGPGRSRLDLEYLDLAGLPVLEPAAGTATTLEVPAMDVRVQGLHRAGLPLGELAFSLRNEGADLLAENIVGDIAGLELLPEQPGHMVWRQGEQAATQLDASLHFGDLGASLHQLGYERILETEEGRLDLDLQWPGGPQAFSLLPSRGSLLVDIEDGRFLEAPSGASGALRVVSILNLAEIVRRLSLSHMFESGIGFRGVDGEVFLHGGTIEVAGIDVKGSSSGFQFSVVSDVEAQSLQGELVATLPVANNLPWVAALAGGLPVAAGVFVVSKVFEKQMNRLSSAVYRISGTWDEPQVEFDRIFDDSAGDVSIPEPVGESLPDGAQESGDASMPDEAAVVVVAPDPQAPAQPDSP